MGSPVHDERLLFKMLMLEGAQAGLFLTILHKPLSHRAAFATLRIELIMHDGMGQLA
jgi:3-methyladenine DNA glycosylase Tag